jgi:EAL domain-containing protein (putative c-di-GMP-specific phosphodiesterase class I)/ActR/RegA family two-component response regulator
MNEASSSPRTAEPPAAALVVDDDAFVREVLGRQLQSLGVGRVAAAADGDEARLRLRDGGDFGLIVLDLEMPGCDGIELMREIGERQPDASLILISSADARVLRTARELALQRGLRVAGAFGKPVGIEDLRTGLRTLAHASRPARSAPGSAGAQAPLGVADLAAALDRDEIRIHVQPEVDLRSGAVHGVEVLARWHSPEHGFVPPDRFIALAESGKLIQRLTDVVMRLAVMSGRQWDAEGLSPCLAVNVSPHCLDDLRLPEQVVALVEGLSFDVRRLLLEVTESGVAGRSARSLDILARLRLKGFELAIDDFGTGYSSLQQLQRIPFTQLKVDRSFVSRAATDEDARHIVSANIRLAHDLGLRVVAEGVETLAELALLRELGCDLAQGYLLARPMPPEEFPAWVRGFRLPGS